MRRGSLVPPVPVILVTGMGSEHVATEALRRGVADYVKKAHSFWDGLPSSIERVVKLHQVETRCGSAGRRGALAQGVRSYAGHGPLPRRARVPAIGERHLAGEAGIHARRSDRKTVDEFPDPTVAGTTRNESCCRSFFALGGARTSSTNWYAATVR